MHVGTSDADSFQTITFNTSASNWTEGKTTFNMGFDCCGQQAQASAPMTMPIAAPAEQTNSYRSADYDDGHSLGTLNIKSPSQRERAQDTLDDCCSSGNCIVDKTERDTDTPDCCRGKVSPCCDTSCLDRLAMRECEMNAATVLAPDARINSE